MMKTLFKFILITQLLILSSLSVAQIPDTQYSQGISYITGGVGEGESQAILSEAKQWPLLLEMSQIENGRGVWIFGAMINILNDKSQTIFNAQADGPYMLVNLEAGAYTIQASFNGVQQTRSVAIKANSPQKINLFWK
jgi:hypothetical protein